MTSWCPDRGRTSPAGVVSRLSSVRMPGSTVPYSRQRIRPWEGCSMAARGRGAGLPRQSVGLSRCLRVSMARSSAAEDPAQRPGPSDALGGSAKPHRRPVPSRLFHTPHPDTRWGGTGRDRQSRFDLPADRPPPRQAEADSQRRAQQDGRHADQHPRPRQQRKAGDAGGRDADDARGITSPPQQWRVPPEEVDLVSSVSVDQAGRQVAEQQRIDIVNTPGW